MADSLGVVRLQNQIIDDYIQLTRSLNVTPGRAAVSLVYERLPERSMMRQVMVGYYVSGVKAKWFEENAKNLLEDFTRDCLVAFAEAVNIGKRPVHPGDRDKCSYHVHNEDVPTCS